MDNVNTTGWNETMISLYASLNDYLEGLIMGGQMINPDIQIDEALASEFLQQAKTELDPYYGQIISQSRRQLLQQSAFAQQQADLSIQSAQASAASSTRSASLSRQGAVERAEYERKIAQGDLPQQMAEMGLAFSGERIKAAGRIDEATQMSINQANRAYSSAASASSAAAQRAISSTQLGLRQNMFNLGFGAEEKFGSEFAGGLNLPYYQISDGVVGALERERTTAEQLRASQIESAYRSNRALDYYEE